MTAEPAAPVADESLSLEVRDGGIGWLVLDQPGSDVNLLSTAVLERLDQVLEEIEALAAEDRLRALVVASGKPGSFVAGTDLDELTACADAQQAEALALAGQHVLRRLEQLPVPTIAAIQGSCLGSGLELALACSYRLASDSPGTRFALPQVRLGLIPGLGGTVRLPRLVGLQASLRLILGGSSIDAREALRVRLVDDVSSAHQFEGRVERFARERVERGRMRGGAWRRVPLRLMEDTAPGRLLVLARARRQLVPQVEYAAPAPRRALETVAEGISLPLEHAFRHEAAVLGELAVTDKARALLHSSRLLQRAGRKAAPLDCPSIHRVAVLGAGAVGSELSYLLTAAELPIRLKDRRRTSLQLGLQHVGQLLNRDVREGRLAAGEARRREGLLVAASGYGGFGVLDLVIAAVGRDPEAAVGALREAEQHTRDECLLASTDPTHPVTDLQQALERPERALGLYFARPADLFPLVEVVPGRDSSPRAVAAACELAHRLGRIPSVARDERAPVGVRLLGAYFAEALRLLEQGVAVSEIDAAAGRFGMALGPFRRMDAVGVERCVHLLEHLEGVLGERMRPAEIVRRLSGRPVLFYRYANGLPAQPDPALAVGPRDPEEGAAERIERRLVLALVNEAAHALDQGAARSPDEVDVAALAGLGFPRVRGGPLFHADQLGLPQIAALLREHAAVAGEAFAPAPLLQRLADEGRGFYPAPAGHRAHGVLR